jgi:hypothetical protein
LVVVGQYWRGEDEVRTRLLSERWQVFHITPIGYARSDRAPGYAGEALPGQVLAVLDNHDVERFAIWGYSAGAAMAACVARATPRAAALVCGGYNLFEPLTPGKLRQLDRRLRPDHASRSLWWWVNSFDWASEVGAMSCACLLYWGSEDRQVAKKLRSATASPLLIQDFDHIEFAGLDHVTCDSREALESDILPTVGGWLSSRLGRDR